ncbi:MAG: hypothetical protein ABI316_08700 [Casimicrobiaceae bacterium]
MSARSRRTSPYAPRYTLVRGRQTEFATIERRRREYVGEAAAQAPVPTRFAHRARSLARAAAAAALVSTSCALAFSLFLAFSQPQAEPGVARGRLNPSTHRLAAREQGRKHRSAAALKGAPAGRREIVAHASPIARQIAQHAPAPERTARIVANTLRATSGGLALEAQPWQLTADGTWQTEVVARFADASGTEQTRLRASVDITAAPGAVVDLDPWLHQTPSALVTTDGSKTVEVDAVALSPTAATATLALPAPAGDAASFASVARAIGPHLIAIGWTPLPVSSGVRSYRIYRSAAGGGAGSLVAVVSAAGHAWRDAHVEPNNAYEYSVVADLPQTPARAHTAQVDTPEAMPETSIAAIAGKGMFLFFSPDTGDPNSYAQFDPDTVVAQAVKAGVSEIELRVSRGTFSEAASPQARLWFDRLIDGASAAGIKLLAWSVPRRSSADDVAQSIAMAQYRTPAGNGFAGLALDLEPGDNYMGHGAAARERIADYMEMARAAVGPDYLLIATVISPRLTHWTNEEYPYSRIARYASVMQPMEYWHHFHRSHEYAQGDVASACADVVALTKLLAGRNVPVNVAGQSTDLGRTGSPSPAELHWCLGAAKSAGAIGETFFDYQGTTPDQWAAIEAYRW